MSHVASTSAKQVAGKAAARLPGKPAPGPAGKTAPKLPGTPTSSASARPAAKPPAGKRVAKPVTPAPPVAAARGRKVATGAATSAMAQTDSPARTPVGRPGKAARTRRHAGEGEAAAAPRKTRPSAGRQPVNRAKYGIGDIVRHRFYPFRGVVFDIDPVFANTEDWWRAIPPELRPNKNQPFYHLLAENDETEYIAYVSEQNLIADKTGAPLRHPQITEMFVEDEEGRLHAVFRQEH